MSGAAIRASALLHVVFGIGFSSVALLSIRRLRRTGELPMTPFGFRAFDGGPIDVRTNPAFVPLLKALAVAGAVDAVAGALLWRGDRRGASLSLVTSPVSFVLAVGFALPLQLIGIPARLVLLAAGRSALQGHAPRRLTG